MAFSQRFEWQVRGTPLWLLQEYLQELGGELTAPGYLRADGWQASLTQMDDFQLGSLRVGQVHLILDVEPAAEGNILPALQKKLLRAGG